MLVKIVDTLVAIDRTGMPVDAIPVRTWAEGEANLAGYPVDAVEIEESDDGIPVRFAAGKSALNSAGHLVDVIPVKGAWWSPYPAPPGYRWEFVLSDLDGSKVEDDLSNEPIVELVRAA